MACGAQARMTQAFVAIVLLATVALTRYAAAATCPFNGPEDSAHYLFLAGKDGEWEPVKHSLWGQDPASSPNRAAQQTCKAGAMSNGSEVCIEVPMPTPWSADVNPSSPLPEYPRPQMQREQWLSLNGVWEFESHGVQREAAPPLDRPLRGKIVVPFPPEAPLSGVQGHDANHVRLWYKRNFTLPSAWAAAPPGTRVFLHFGAVDWESEVFVNGASLGVHRGGYDKFSYDITEALGGELRGLHTLAVRVFDPSEMAAIPLGKQRARPPRHPSNIWYTATSGIWQTVWLEPVPPAHVTRLDLIPNVEKGQLRVTVIGSRAGAGRRVRAVALDHGNEVGAAEGRVGEAFAVPVPRPRLWSPDGPHLYNLDVKLLGDGDGTGELVEDAVRGYFGMRSIALGRVGPGGNLRPLLNGRFEFQMGLLDQGFWPDGVYTAPTDEALASDIAAMKDLGYNILRKHVKVEPDRWYYHADRLGMLVWQDMPSAWLGDDTDRAQWEHELNRMIEEHRSFPSIVVYVIWNEGWGQYDTERTVALAQSLDASRLYDPASGWTDAPVGDLVDMHLYVGPGSPAPTSSRAAVLGEYGGLGLRLEGHLWIPEDAYCYEMCANASHLQERYLELVAGLAGLMADPDKALSAAVYTELSDVEAEINGLLTYDRQVFKIVDKAVLRAAHTALIEKGRRFRVEDATDARGPSNAHAQQ